MRIARLARSKAGFTLVELLVVVVVLAVLGAIVVPKFVGAGKTSKEAALKSDLQILRNAIQMFLSDTGLYPKTLKDLTKKSTDQTLKGIVPEGANAGKEETPSGCKGPYILNMPDDPIDDTTAADANNGQWTYVNTDGTVRSSSAVVSPTEGTAYNTW